MRVGVLASLVVRETVPPGSELERVGVAASDREPDGEKDCVADAVAEPELAVMLNEMLTVGALA